MLFSLLHGLTWSVSHVMLGVAIFFVIAQALSTLSHRFVAYSSLSQIFFQWTGYIIQMQVYVKVTACYNLEARHESLHGKSRPGPSPARCRSRVFCWEFEWVLHISHHHLKQQQRKSRSEMLSGKGKCTNTETTRTKMERENWQRHISKFRDFESLNLPLHEGAFSASHFWRETTTQPSYWLLPLWHAIILNIFLNTESISLTIRIVIT